MNRKQADRKHAKELAEIRKAMRDPKRGVVFVREDGRVMATYRAAVSR